MATEMVPPQFNSHLEFINPGLTLNGFTPVFFSGLTVDSPYFSHVNHWAQSPPGHHLTFVAPKTTSWNYHDHPAKCTIYIYTHLYIYIHIYIYIYHKYIIYIYHKYDKYISYNGALNSTLEILIRFATSPLHLRQIRKVLEAPVANISTAPARWGLAFSPSSPDADPSTWWRFHHNSST